MPTIRQRLTNFLLGDEKRKLEATTRALWEAYQDGPFVLPPDELVRQISEYDSAVLEDLVMQLQWEKFGAFGYSSGDSSAERRRQVQESYRLWKYNPLAQWEVWCWTNFGFGDEIIITCEDEQADEVFQAAWGKSAIFADDKIHDLSNVICYRGNVFFVAFEDTMTGEVKFSTIPQAEIVDIITDPDDSKRALFYKRQWTDARSVNKTLYYPAYDLIDDSDALSRATLPQDAQRADQPNGMAGELEQGRPATIAYIMHSAHNCKDDASLWGWPILGISAAFLRAQKQFMENRLTVSAQKASFVREFITGGGTRGVASVKSKLASTQSATQYTDTNPPGVGANLIHNKAVEHRDLPMNTGASDAKTDWEMFTHQALIGGGLFPTTAGLDTSRWATALAMDKTQSMLWSRYQTFWSAQFKRIVEITLSAYERRNGTKFTTHDCDVSIDSLNLVDFPAIVDSLSQLFDSALTPLVDNGTITIPAARAIAAEAWRLAFQALGVSNAAELTSDEAFGIGEPGQAAEIALLAARRALKRGEIEEAEFAGFVRDLLGETKNE
jgi:hypothetical protein